ncbi:MAG TPA: type II toxin-antitoxin system RelE/ParE family toxin [Nitrospirota bacterium]|nr:type II toxin-antitoxin system RelE/ParE family toxin [Nitrospirota bacterium]
MKYEVLLGAEAEVDLWEIYRYAERYEPAGVAHRLLDRIEQEVVALAETPTRGACPPELAHIGVREFGEVSCKPYRIIYEVRGSEVVVQCVLDGRKPLTDVLAERLLR